jgi:hypothetical protein
MPVAKATKGRISWLPPPFKASFGNKKAPPAISGADFKKNGGKFNLF